MKAKVPVFVIMFLLTCNFGAISQSVTKPNYGLKSHETLEVSKIETSAEKTIVHLIIENRIDKGNFCADKNIYLIDPSGTKMKLLKASGIPACPDSYKFKSIGEKLNFILTFPPLKTDVVCVDLIEECYESCFSFYGLVLDKKLNKELDEAFSLAESGQQYTALERFIKLADNNINIVGIEPLLYFNIIKLSVQTGNKVQAGDWYRKLDSKSLTGGKIYIDQLNLLGIRY
jgi:hypothetical protein